MPAGGDRAIFKEVVEIFEFVSDFGEFFSGELGESMSANCRLRLGEIGVPIVHRGQIFRIMVEVDEFSPFKLILCEIVVYFQLF